MYEMDGMRFCSHLAPPALSKLLLIGYYSKHSFLVEDNIYNSVSDHNSVRMGVVLDVPVQFSR